MFIAPTAYHHILSLALAAKASTPSTRFCKVSNVDQYDYFLWPVNIGGYHWVLVFHSLVSGSPLFYCDSWGDDATRKSRMTPTILEAINFFFQTYNKQFRWASTSCVSVPYQHMNDRGAVVNELMRKVMMNESLVHFDLNQEIGVQLRITQTRDVLVYLNNQGL